MKISWLVALTLTQGVALAQDVPSLVAKQLPELVTTYQGLHQKPELSRYEANTSAWLAGELRSAGYTVTDHIGKYTDGSRAYGVVALLKNGVGPTLLIRTDMDALPVEEKTGLPYASAVKMKNAAGQEVSVMHACGHDLHMTTMVGVARVMFAEKAKWHGTLMLIGQPAERRRVVEDLGAAGLAQQFCQQWVCLVQPAAKGDAVGLVDDAVRVKAVKFLEHRAAHQLGVQNRHAVDPMRA